MAKCISLPEIPIPPLPPGFDPSASIALPTISIPGGCCSITIPPNAITNFLANKVLSATLGLVPSDTLKPVYAILDTVLTTVQVINDLKLPQCPRQ